MVNLYSWFVHPEFWRKVTWQFVFSKLGGFTWWLMVVSNYVASKLVITLFRGLSNQLTGV